MWLNYSTGVVEHIDLTASQSFRAKIREVSCLFGDSIKLFVFDDPIEIRSHSVFHRTKIVCFETENAPKYPSAPPDQLLLGFVGAALPLPSTSKASVVK